MLNKEFYLQDTITIARELIGATFVRKFGNEFISGRIVETEAYLSTNDEASHSSRGITKRNAAMFESGGILYVYLIYGIHHCINVVTEGKEIGSAVLIRALEPITGIDTMKENRNENNILKLCKGPANLTKALGLNLTHNFSSLISDNLYIIPKSNEVSISTSERIGINKSKDLQLRFCETGSAYVSSNKK